RVLALGTNRGKIAAGVGDALLALIEDADRDVRMIAVRAVASLGADAPKGTPTSMARAFERADESEKLTLLRAGKQVGATELINLAIADPSPLVRIEAIDAAMGSMRAGATLSAALSDLDPQVRRAALERLADDKNGLDAAATLRALGLAVS